MPADGAPVEEHLLVCQEYGALLAGWDAGGDGQSSTGGPESDDVV